MNEKKHEKNYGIEWLRILSMYMVAVLHTLGQGDKTLSKLFHDVTDGRHITAIKQSSSITI